jgi:hypothetical protein
MRLTSSIGFALSLGCAWILWFESNQTIGDTSYRPEWEVAGSTDTFEKCQEQQEHALAAHLQRLISGTGPEFKPFLGKDSQSYSRTSKDGSEVVMRIGPTLVWEYKGASKLLKYTCWPENRDPRR